MEVRVPEGCAWEDSRLVFAKCGGLQEVLMTDPDADHSDCMLAWLENQVRVSQPWILTWYETTAVVLGAPSLPLLLSTVFRS